MSERGMNLVSERDDAVAALRSFDSTGELFVINLCASMTPVQFDQHALPAGFDHYKVYQVSRIEDGRRRYRLRLGFFNTEAAAENVLVAVRSRFATAFATCLCNEDLKSASTFLKRPLQDLQHEFDTQRTGRFKVTRPMTMMEPTVAASASAPEQKSVKTAKNGFSEAKMSLDQQLDALIERELSSSSQAPSMSQPGAHSGNAPRPQAGRPLELTASTPPVAVSPQRAASTSHFHVGSGVNIPDMGLTLTPESQVGSPAAPAPASSNAMRHAVANFAAKHSVQGESHQEAASKNGQHAAPIAKPAPATAAPNKAVAAPVKAPAPVAAPVVTQASKPIQPSPSKATTMVVTPPASAAPLGDWRQEAGIDDIPTLDTTQTLRPLSKQELEDPSVAKWFVVQLAISNHPLNLDAMPHLDIFEAYTLYSVAVLENGGTRYGLRLGFFSEDVSAQAVMGYLRTFFGSPSIERVSKAEHERFSAPPPKKAVEPVQQKVATPPMPMPPSKPKAEVIPLEAKRPVTAPPSSTPAAAKEAPKTKVAAKSAPLPQQSKPLSPPPTQSGRSNSAFGTAPTNKSIAPSPEVSMPAIRPMVTTRITGKYAAPSVRHARTGSTNVPLKKTYVPTTSPTQTQTQAQADLLDGAELLGLSDSQILRVKSNPSLLSRLVGKLTR